MRTEIGLNLTYLIPKPSLASHCIRKPPPKVSVQHLTQKFYILKFSPGAPVFFRKELKNQDATEGDDVTLRCELSKPGVRVEWRKGGMVLHAGKKFEMRQEGCVQELCIRNLVPEDNGYYTCDAGDQLTTASLVVQGSHS